MTWYGMVCMYACMLLYLRQDMLFAHAVPCFAHEFASFCINALEASSSNFNFTESAAKPTRKVAPCGHAQMARGFPGACPSKTFQQKQLGAADFQ